MARTQKLSPEATRILQALRAGDMDATEMRERWRMKSGSALAALVAAGYIARRGGSTDARYSLTDLGRRHCPPRNPIALNRRAAKPVWAGAGDVRGPSPQRIGAGLSTLINET